MSHSDDRVTIFVPASLKHRLPILGRTVSRICQAALLQAVEQAEQGRSRAASEPDYWAEHGDDQVAVKLIDLATVTARLRQVGQEGPAGAPVEFARLFTCDLPRLERYLPPAAVADIRATAPGIRKSGELPRHPYGLNGPAGPGRDALG
jgi:hypothetical protein